MPNLCDECWYNTYDEETGECYCDLQLDEDEYAKFIQYAKSGSCKYFRPDIGEYGIVRKQN